LGGKDGQQAESFFSAVGKVVTHFKTVDFEVEVEYMTNSRMRKEELSFKDMIDWLLGSHIHFIITHPHQGLEKFGHVTAIYEQVNRLEYHLGFPAFNQLRCPIFTQNKWLYLQHLPSIMPTHKITFQEVAEVSE
jgi:hypothetical protein